MQNIFTTPEYLSGIRDPSEKQGDTENRTWGEFAVDTGIALAQPVVSLGRTVTQTARMLSEDPARGPLAEADMWVGRQEKAMRDARSTRAQALDTQSLAPGPDERSFWREPIAGSIHAALPSVAPAAAAIYTGGLSVAAPYIAAAVIGAQGGGEAVNQLRDYADTTPVDELKKLPVWDDYVREFNGDIPAARNKLFNEMLDPKSIVFNFLVNAAEVPAFLRGTARAGVRPTIARRAVGAAEGAAEGAVLGGLEGGSESYMEQLAKVRRGEQQAIDTGDIESGIASGATFAGPMAALHAIRPPTRQRVQPIGTTEMGVLERQINEELPGGAGPRPQAQAIDTTEPAAVPPSVMPEIGTPDQTPVPGQGQDVVTPEAQRPPRFPDIGPPGFPDPGEFGGEPGGSGAPPGFVPPEPSPRTPRSQMGFSARAQDQAQPYTEDGGGNIVQTFRTSRGSEYALFDDGTTVRNKAQRPEHGPDQGLKERSQQTVFLTPEHEQAMRMLMTTRQLFPKRIAQTRSGLWGVQYTGGPSAGKFERRTVGRAMPEPAPGLHPVEIWQDGQRFHFGNEIVEASPSTRPQRPRRQDALVTPEVSQEVPPARVGDEIQGLPTPVITPEEQGAPAFPEIERPRHPLFESEVEPTPEPEPDTRNPVLAQLQDRMAERRRREEYAENERQAEERRRQEARGDYARPPVRTGRESTGLERAFEASVRAYKAAPFAQTREKWQALRQRAANLDQRRLAAKIEPRDYVGQLGDAPPSDEARRTRQAEERRQIMEKARARRAGRGLSVLPKKERVEAAKAEGSEQETRFAQIVRELDTMNPDLISTKGRELFYELMDINKKRARGRARLPIPIDLYEKLEKAGLVNLPGLPGEEVRAPTDADAAALSAAIDEKVASYFGDRKVVGRGAKRRLVRVLTKPGKGKKKIAVDLLDEGSVETALFRKWARRQGLMSARGVTRKGKRLATTAVEAPLSDEERVRRAVEEREAKARARADEGRAPLREGHKLPTAEQAIEEFRAGKRRIAAGERVRGARARALEAREGVIKTSLRDAINKRFGTEKRFRQLLDQLEVLSSLPRNISEGSRAPANADEEMQSWFAKTAAKGWYGAKREEVRLIRQLKKFLEYAIDRTNRDLQDYQKKQGITGRTINWGLAIPMRRDRTGPVTFRSGLEDPKNAYYNFANDLQKLDEAIRRALVNLETVEKDVSSRTSMASVAKGAPGYEVRSPGRTGQMSTLRQEYLAHLREFERRIPDIVSEMDLFLRGDINAVSERRRLLNTAETMRRSSEPVDEVDTGTPEIDAPMTATQLAGAEDRASVNIEGEPDSFVPERAITGGGYTAARENINVVEQQTIDRIDLKIRAERNAARAALKNMSEQEQRWAMMREQFPIKWTPANLLGKVRKFVYDTEGLPVDRLSYPDGETPTQAQQDAMDAADQLNGAGEPTHKLVSQPETVFDTMSRVRRMVDEGKLPTFPREYITPQFIDRLGAITSGVKVYHAPTDATSNLGTEGVAHFDGSNDRLVLPDDVSPELYARAAIHETGHAAMANLLNQDPKFTQAAYDLWRRAVEHAHKRGQLKLTKAGYIERESLPRLLYGLVDPHEMLSETMSNEKFREYLSRIPGPPQHPVIAGARNVMNAIYRAIRDAFRRVIGAKDGDTALDVLYYDQSTVLGLADQMIARSVKELERTGRPAFVMPDPTASFGGDGIYFLRMAGAKAFADSIVGKAQETGHEMGDQARYAWDTIGKNRGRGLTWHTLYDITQRGGQAFRELSAKLFEIVERTFAERAKIMRDQDAPKLDRIERFLNGLSKENAAAAQDLLIDESYHGAFIDVPLTDKSNRHLHDKSGAVRDTLKNAQIIRDHEGMQQRYQEMVRAAPEFAEIRKLVHDWAAKRELEMRSGRIRDLLKASGLMDGVSRGTQPALLDALERYVDVNVKPADMTKAELDLINNNIADPTGPKVLDVLHRIAGIEDLKRIAGPYTPFTRRGDYAISGRITPTAPANAVVWDGGLNRKTGDPIGDPRYVFKTEEEARQFIAEVSDKYGIKLTHAGEVYVDTTTDKPAMGDDPDDPDRQVRLRGKALQEAIDAGEPIEKRYYAQFQTKLLEFHPTERAAAKSAAEWQALHGDNVKVSMPKDVLRHDGRQNEQYVGSQLANMIRTMRASETYQNMSPAEQGSLTDIMNLAAAQYTMRRGIKQRYLPRGYVQGASRNVLETYNEWSSMTAGYLAKVRHSNDLEQRSDAMRKYVKDNEYQQGDANAMVHQRVYDNFMQRLHQPTTNPRDTWLNRQIDRGLRYTMLDKLPSIAYFTVNATEPSIVAAPLMTDRHSPGNIVGAMATMYRIAGASRFMQEGWKDVRRAFKRQQGRFDWRTLFSDRIKGEPDAQRLDDLYKQANDRAMFDASASMDYDRAFLTSRNNVDRAADWLQGIFQAANTAVENLNRFVTMGTAYRLEYSRLAKTGAEDAHQQAVDYALGKAHQASGQYAAFNAPPAFLNTAFGRVLFQFKKYPQRIMANYIRAAVGTVRAGAQLAKGEQVSGENKERARQLAYMLATQGLVAGALGLPTEIFAVPLNTLFIAGLSPYNWEDAQAGFRQFAANNFGPEMGELMSHGVLRLTGVDVASRLSQSSMVTFGSPATNKPRDLQASLATMFTGALGSSSFEFLQGLQKLAAGTEAVTAGADTKAYKDFAEAAKHLALFRMAGDVIDAANKMSPEGMQTQTGRIMREPYGPFEAAVRAAGFQPAREAESGEARRAIKLATDRYKAERKSWTDMWAQSTPGERTALWPQIQQWNQFQPTDNQITRSDLLRAVGVRQRAERQPAEALGLATDKRSRAFLPQSASYMMQ